MTDLTTEYLLDISGAYLLGIVPLLLFFMILNWVGALKERGFDAIFGAISAVFVITFSFALIYLYVDQNVINCIDERDGWDFAYFSVTTFTTLGYGDLKPYNICRLITSFEAVIGYITLGVILADLIRKFSRDKVYDGEKETE